MSTPKPILCWTCNYDALPGDVLCGPCRQYANEHPPTPEPTPEERRQRTNEIIAKMDAILARMERNATW